MIRTQPISLLKLFLLYWCDKRRKCWRNWILCKMDYCFLLMVLWMVKTLNIFHQLFEQWSPIRHEVSFHFYGTCTCAICFLWFKNVFDQMAGFKQDRWIGVHTVKVECQIKGKLWFHLSGLPEICVMVKREYGLIGFWKAINNRAQPLQPYFSERLH